MVYGYVSHPRRMDILSTCLQKNKTMQADNFLSLFSHHPPTPSTKVHNGVHNQILKQIYSSSNTYPVSFGYDIILSSYRVLSVTVITTKFSHLKSAHLLSLFLTRHKVTYTVPAVPKFLEEKILRN